MNPWNNLRSFAVFFLLTAAIPLASCGSSSSNASNKGATGTSYTIGGTINGLTGTLELQNNSTDDLKTTSNGAFTFATPVGDKSSYNVSVKSSPTGQSCGVVNGTGNVSGANVTDVEVRCTNNNGGGSPGGGANTYKVGGTVSGLSGTLVLQNRGGDDLTIGLNGAFVFPTPLANGSYCNVSVKTDPTGQTCTVANGTQTISGADITNIQVTCVSSASIKFIENYTYTGSDGYLHRLHYAYFVLKKVPGDKLNYCVTLDDNGYFYSSGDTGLWGRSQLGSQEFCMGLGGTKQYNNSSIGLPVDLWDRTHYGMWPNDVWTLIPIANDEILMRVGIHEDNEPVGNPNAASELASRYSRDNIAARWSEFTAKARHWTVGNVYSY